jgi:peptide subunit release factor RF-3
MRSDWMTVERERGISVSSAVMSVEHEGLAFNLLVRYAPFESLVDCWGRRIT